MKVKLHTHDGMQYVEFIEDFSLEEFINEVNSESHRLIQFGGIGISKNQIKLIDTNQTVADEPTK